MRANAHTHRQHRSGHSQIADSAVRDGDVYRIFGQKIWISSAQVACKCILLARTTPLEEVKKPSEGLSVFFIDMGRDLPGLDLRIIRKMGIGQNQGIQHPLALAYMNLEAANWPPITQRGFMMQVEKIRK